MGSRIQKIAFIVFALLFVAIMAVINTGILNMGTNANKQLSTTVQTSNSSTLELYNNTTLSGDTVASAAKNPNSLANTGLTIGVVTSATNTVAEYDGSDNTYKANSNDPEYINPSAQFKSYLCQNDNGVVAGILFVQEGSGYDVQPTVSLGGNDLTVVGVSSGD